MNTLLKGQSVIFDNTDEVCCANIICRNGKVMEIQRGHYGLCDESIFEQVIDAGRLVVMAGIVDSHVHVNEPGRTDWEGFETATKAAAAGGITTIVDMPLNCSPVTTSVQALETKLACMPGKCHVDVAFWGGVVPGNQHELVPMVKAGVVGFKCFLIHSGLDEFPNVSEADLHLAMTQMKGTNSVLLFHAELDSCGCTDVTGDVTKYETFLASRPREWEQDAIKLVCRLCLQYKVRCHIVHLSSGDAVPIIRQAQSEGAPLTVETCNHYLTLYAEEVPTGATEYKCAPPVREKSNQDVLWEAIGSGVIQTIVSDHSPCPPEMKNPETGNFMTAWGGISSLQFGLSLFWTGAKEKGFSLRQVQRLLCENTAALCHLDGSKGSIAVGKDADFVIWDPEATIMIETGMIQHRHKLTPYLNRPFYGVVHKTIVRGRIVYEANQPIPSASGQPILLQ